MEQPRAFVEAVDAPIDAPAAGRYALAGYKRSDAAASRMLRNVKVSARVRELKEKVAEKVIIEEAELLKELAVIARAEVEEVK